MSESAFDLPGLRYLANCSMLFTERPLLERPAAARAAAVQALMLAVIRALTDGTSHCASV